MPDNRQIKDGLGNLFTIRMRDLSAAHDGTVQRSMIFATPYPVDYGIGGIYQHCARTAGDVQAGLTSAPIYAFRYASAGANPLLALLTRINISAWTTTSGFLPGLCRFSMWPARPFGTQDSGGTVANLGGNTARLAPGMASPLASIVYSNGPPLSTTTDGRTLDGEPMASRTVVAPNQGNTPLEQVKLFERLPSEHPHMMANAEGFVITATVPPGGSWQFAITSEWAEVPQF
jgi:hypothetical protein